MTQEEVRQLKVGDIVWILCRDIEPGTAAKCRVTKGDDGYGTVEVKCVGRPDCEGHSVWYGDIRKSEVEVYKKAIASAKSIIDCNNETIRCCREENRQKKMDIVFFREALAKIKAEKSK